ncbi:Mur ligase family protein [Thermogutta sp.]|jgi:UDP-N-acetylmuramoyl-L-alanyl-D-glutamate--2,6-diaminopimelate ligase|uniref:Mur ligase family protein n=1 Tax=Thermogutta sp. TaxID=1962930 RepID=UPI00321FBA49
MRLCASTGQTIAIRQVLPDAQMVGATEVSFTRCRCRPSDVRPGDLFVVLYPPGARRDAALQQALTRGCAAVLADHPLETLPVPVIYVSNAREAFGRISHALADYPARKLHVIGVTGAYGKTTTACLLTRVLVEAGFNTGMLSTLGYFEGEESTFPRETTPPADELALSLARMVENHCTHAVIEVTGKAIRERYLAGTELDAAVLVNTDAESKADHRNSYFHVLEWLKPEGVAIVNADDSGCRSWLSGLAHPALTVGLQMPAEIKGREISRQLGEEIFYLIAGEETFPVRTRMFGRHHILSCLAAAAVGLVYQIPVEVIVKALESVDQIPGRLQPVLAGQPFSVFVDAADSTQAIRATLTTIRPLVSGRLICVAHPPRRCQGDTAAWVQTLEELADVIVLTLPGVGEGHTNLLAAGAKHLRDRRRAMLLPDRTEAIGWALTQARPGDCVLLLGNGHRLWKATRNGELIVDDYRFVRQWLEQEYPA